MPKQRNRFEKDSWTLTQFVNHALAQKFDCNDNDLNDFFRNDLTPHETQLLTKTYTIFPKELLKKSKHTPIALISYCNDRIPLEKIKNRITIANEKTIYRYLPAVKIARLGVCNGYRNHGIGSHILNITKSFFLTENRTGCRILTVDAYNKDEVIGFYKKNHFDFMTDKDKNKQARTMYYDLIRTSLE